MEARLYLIAAFYGFVGSIAYEAILWRKSIGPRGGTPAIYKNKTFLAGRLGLAIIAGIVASAMANPNYDLIIYVYIGLSFESFATKLGRKDKVESGDDEY